LAAAIDTAWTDGATHVSAAPPATIAAPVAAARTAVRLLISGSVMSSSTVPLDLGSGLSS
jgi:hypothetical protein